MAIRGIESYRSALQITEQTKNRIVSGSGEESTTRAAGQDTIEISADGRERYRGSLFQPAAAGLNHNDNGTGVIMTDFHTLIGSRMSSIYGEKNGNGADYLKGLQEKFPKMTFSIGTGLVGKTKQNTGANANRWAFTVSPKLLEKMSGDPEAEAEYTQKLRDIERATALADNFSKAMGMKTVYCENYIDENGQLHHTSISVRKDELNEKLREEARENTEKMIERVRAKNKEAADKLEELLNKAEESGELVLDGEDMRWIGSAAKSLEALQKREDDDADGESEGEYKKSGGMVGINAARLARQLAAAKTRSQVQAVIAQIRSDLQECDDGKAQGMDVDESSYAAAQQLLQQAQQQLGQAENREATPEEEMASALAALM